MSDVIASSSISYALAIRLMAAAVEIAETRGVALGFAILNPAGHLVVSARMDGAAFITAEIARGKAFACAAAGGLSGAALSDIHLRDPAVWSGIAQIGFGAPVLPAHGAMPIFLDGTFIGAIGASGAAGQVDAGVITDAVHSIGGSVEC
jgi:glc operon protein GlcG